MEIKDFILIVIAFLGWTWGVILYFINRKLQRKEKMTDRRFEVYSGYMKKADELMTTDLKVNFWRLEYLWVKTAKNRHSHIFEILKH
jgi:uncharacterized membrane protein SpoIIM required for sporulation